MSRLVESSPASSDTTGLLETEWLLPNGLGGYAMGSGLGGNTRRYHGLLIAATRPPLGRLVALHSFIDELDLAAGRLPLATQQFGEEAVLHPEGWQSLERFDVDLEANTATWHYQAGDVTVARTLHVCPGRNAITMEWRISGLAEPAVLRLRPLVALRDFHELGAEDHPRADRSGHRWTIRRGDHVATLRAAPAAESVRLVPDAQWWRRLAYIEDARRHQGWHEDVWSPGAIEAELPPGDHVVAIEAEVPGAAPPPLVPRPSSSCSDPVRRRLAQAADSFVVQRRDGDAWATSVIAGYPWFADWGRDTMISLPGLLLATRRLTAARSTLDFFARRLQHGLLPNCFHDHHDALYNTADASLWFVHAVWSYHRANRYDDIDPLLDACRAILEAYRAGTGFGISVGDDGLVSLGDSSPVTWMDAQRDGVVFTPRHGKPVEINALWYHALHCVAELTRDESESARLVDLARRAGLAMRLKFWWPERRCCHDVLVEGDLGDERMRPNQIFAVSLPHSPLTAEQQVAVVDQVRRDLLTPFGLRTLAPDDPAYRGRYEGDLFQRDGAYHNGTVWPWLIGPYVEAVLRVGDFSEAVRARAATLLEPIIAELDRGCRGQLAEVYDGDRPHRPSGCPAQAWSVAEVLRVRDLIDAGDRGRGSYTRST